MQAPLFASSDVKESPLIRNSIFGPTLLGIVTLQCLFLFSVSLFYLSKHFVHFLNFRREFLTKTVNLSISRLKVLN